MIEAAELIQLPVPEFLTGHERTIVVIHGPRSFHGMNGSDRVRACYQHCVLQYMLRCRCSSLILCIWPAICCR